MDTEQPTILITGGASGMGLATVELFLAEGWRVLALDVCPVTSDVAGPGELHSRTADVRSRTSVEAAMLARSV